MTEEQRPISKLLMLRKHKIHSHWCRFSRKFGWKDKGRVNNSSWCEQWRSEVPRTSSSPIIPYPGRAGWRITCPSRKRWRLPSQSPSALKFLSVGWPTTLPPRASKQVNRAEPNKNSLTFPRPPFFLCLKVYLLEKQCWLQEKYT